MSKKKDTLTLTRTGTFGFITVGSQHCGIAPEGTRQDARYIVTTKCKPILDGRDFLFEQRTVDEYFQKVTRVRSSCEKLVMRMAEELVDVIMGENPACEIIWIKVRVIAAPYAAHMQYKYHP